MDIISTEWLYVIKQKLCFSLESAFLKRSALSTLLYFCILRLTPYCQLVFNHLRGDNVFIFFRIRIYAPLGLFLTDVYHRSL